MSLALTPLQPWSAAPSANAGPSERMACYLKQPVEEQAIRSELRTVLDLPGVAQVILRIRAGGKVLSTPRRDPDEVTFRTSVA